jgi:DegV family protein with EDD domain
VSGSYNSAVLARELALEERPEMKIHIFNSRSASVGETLITRKIMECEDAGMDFETLIETVERYIDSQNTYFVLESLEALRKNGRLSNVKAFFATALKIKPVMGATPDGHIIQLDQARGINKALVKMVDYIVEQVEHPQDKVLAITHCNAPERGAMVRDAILARIPVKDVILLDTAGVSTLYASDGGIIVVI